MVLQCRRVWDKETVIKKILFLILNISVSTLSSSILKLLNFLRINILFLSLKKLNKRKQTFELIPENFLKERNFNLNLKYDTKDLTSNKSKKKV